MANEASGQIQVGFPCKERHTEDFMKRTMTGFLSLAMMALVLNAAGALAQSSETPDVPHSASAGATDKASQKKEANALKWKERILKVPVGSYVKAKVESHDEFEGQLRDITDSSFSIQVLKGNKIEMVAIQYGDLRSLSVAGQSSTGAKVAKSILFSTL